MKKMNPFFTASMASVAYFVIFLLIKYTLNNQTLDLTGAFLGAIVFWIVMFILHKVLYQKHEN